jgi:hypothetical protein
MTAGYGVTLHSRLQTSQQTVWTGSLNAGVPPHCLRLVRSGNVFRAYESMNGSNWVSLGEQTVSMGQSAFVGLAVSSHEPATRVTARLSRVAVTNTAANQRPQVSLTAPADGTSYTTPATMSVSANASDSDGTVAAVEFYAGTTLIGSDSSSPYSVTWSNAPSGTHSLTAVARDNTGATTTSSPRQVTVASPTNTPPSVTLSSPTNGASFTAPASVSMAASASDSNGSITKVEFYAGTTLVGTDTSSPYSATWNNAGQGTHSMTAKAYDNAGATTTSTAASITIASAPASTLPAGWQSADVGNPALAGSAAFASGAFTVAGAGIDIWDTADQFRYVYQPLQGDGEISACVDSLDYAHGWTKAGVMIRESMSAGSPHAMAMMTSGYGVTLQYRPQASQTSVWTQWLNPGVPPHCLRLVRSGNTFRAYESVNGSNWVSLGEASITMGPSTFVGLAVTSHEPATRVTARFSQVAIGGPSSTNQPPNVSITTPANNASFAAPASVVLGASATDTDGTVASVSFYAGGTLLGTDNSSPFGMTWSNVAAGTHSITAIATDNDGATRTSAPVSITVTGTSTPPPSGHSVIFNPSSNHATNVSSYIVEFFVSGANTSTGTPVRTVDVGKPTPVSGEIRVDVSSTVQAMAAGTYVSTVRATGPGGTARSAPSAPFVR